MKMVTINSQLASILTEFQGKWQVCPRSGMYTYDFLEAKLKDASELKKFKWRLSITPPFPLKGTLLVLMGTHTIKALIAEDIPIVVKKITYKQFLKNLKAFEENMEAA